MDLLNHSTKEEEHHENKKKITVMLIAALCLIPVLVHAAEKRERSMMISNSCRLQ